MTMNLQEAIEKAKDYLKPIKCREFPDTGLIVNSEPIRTLLDAVEQLQREREPLAKTADGVPMYPGMEIWIIGYDCASYAYAIRHDKCSFTPHKFSSELKSIEYDKIFSTAAARDAAMKEGE